MDKQLIALEKDLALAAKLAALAAKGEIKLNATRDNKSNSDLKMGIDLGTSNIVTLILDEKNKPLACRMTEADVVRDGIVWDFFGAVKIVREHIASLTQELGCIPSAAITSFPPGTEARISANVLDAAGIKVSAVIDEPSAVAHLLKLNHAGIVDIGGGTTGVAIIIDGKVVYSADEPTGGHHVSLTIAGNQKIELADAERLKKEDQTLIWPIVRPVFEKMADIVGRMIKDQKINTLYLSGGSCMMRGVKSLFEEEFPTLKIILPENSILLTPLAIAAYAENNTK
ncbi:ethanolamine utilization protein [Gammaproteobacteria bacterium]|nr:ethanolamine utilization protein [Gammaproteobacteria bacterium]